MNYRFAGVPVGERHRASGGHPEKVALLALVGAGRPEVLVSVTFSREIQLVIDQFPLTLTRSDSISSCCSSSLFRFIESFQFFKVKFVLLCFLKAKNNEDGGQHQTGFSLKGKWRLILFVIHCATYQSL